MIWCCCCSCPRWVESRNEKIACLILLETSLLYKLDRAKERIDICKRLKSESSTGTTSTRQLNLPGLISHDTSLNSFTIMCSRIKFSRSPIESSKPNQGSLFLESVCGVLLLLPSHSYFLFFHPCFSSKSVGIWSYRWSECSLPEDGWSNLFIHMPILPTDR